MRFLVQDLIKTQQDRGGKLSSSSRGRQRPGETRRSLFWTMTARCIAFKFEKTRDAWPTTTKRLRRPLATVSGPKRCSVKICYHGTRLRHYSWLSDGPFNNVEGGGTLQRRMLDSTLARIDWGWACAWRASAGGASANERWAHGNLGSQHKITPGPEDGRKSTTRQEGFHDTIWCHQPIVAWRASWTDRLWPHFDTSHFLVFYTHSFQCRTWHWLKMSCTHQVMSSRVWLCVWSDTLRPSILHSSPSLASSFSFSCSYSSSMWVGSTRSPMRTSTCEELGTLAENNPLTEQFASLGGRCMACRLWTQRKWAANLAPSRTACSLVETSLKSDTETITQVSYVRTCRSTSWWNRTASWEQSRLSAGDTRGIRYFGRIVRSMDNKQFPNDGGVERIEIEIDPRHAQILVSTVKLSDQSKLVGTPETLMRSSTTRHVFDTIAWRCAWCTWRKTNQHCNTQQWKWHVTSRSSRNAMSWQSNECVGSWWAQDDAYGDSLDRKHQRPYEATMPIKTLFHDVSKTVSDRVVALSSGESEYHTKLNLIELIWFFEVVITNYITVTVAGLFF